MRKLSEHNVAANKAFHETTDCASKAGVLCDICGTEMTRVGLKRPTTPSAVSVKCDSCGARDWMVATGHCALIAGMKPMNTRRVPNAALTGLSG